MTKEQMIHGLIDLVHEFGSVIYLEHEGGAHWLTDLNLKEFAYKYPNLNNHIVRVVKMADELEALMEIDNAQD